MIKGICRQCLGRMMIRVKLRKEINSLKTLKFVTIARINLTNCKVLKKMRKTNKKYHEDLLPQSQWCKNLKITKKPKNMILFPSDLPLTLFITKLNPTNI